MTTVSVERLLTAEEFVKLPDDGNRYELVEGRLVRMSPSAVTSSAVGADLLVELGSFVKRGRLGRVGISEGGFRLSTLPDVVRVPDIWFLRAERIPAEGLPAGFWPGAPDLAVEVLSPTDRFIDVLRKAQEYLAAGTQLVWVIDPEGRSAAVFRPGAPARILGEDGVLDGEDVLPGFTIALRDLLP